MVAASFHSTVRPGQVERQIGRSIAKRLGAEEINSDETFAQRINGDLRLGDFQRAMAAYNDDPAYWHRLYGDDPQYSDNHAPDAAHGGAVPPSGWWPNPGLTANPADLQQAPELRVPQGSKRLAFPDATAVQAASSLASPSADFFASPGSDRDTRPERSLGRFTYDPSKGSLFVAPPALSQIPADGSLSLNDAYLEYLRRLNANPSSAAAD